MSLQQLKKKSEGFTIIEVLIVLAIAGLIMVIVFIAVPALQRSQRNEARNNDARLITNAVNECLSNRNGVTTSCDAFSATEVVLPSNLNQVTTASFAAAWGTTTAATVSYASQCAADGNSVVGGSARQYAVKYQVEAGSGTANRCISG
jgi:prepilin-type N-terminal cleavage/methylation domain-containing protein